jgi:hypothetical protein
VAGEDLDAARAAYERAREACDKLWPWYRQTLLARAVEAGQPPSEFSEEDRAVLPLWDERNRILDLSRAELWRIEAAYRQLRK